jgi:tetratricopeptide (TPR) repeat protein
MICRPSAPAARGVYSDIALALKTFQRKFFFQSDIRAAFDRETELWSRLGGVPHIMPLIGFDTVDGRPVILMPAIARDHDGIRTVRDVLNRTEPDVEVAASLSAQLAMGMHLAAERLPGLVHGDLKPENLLLSGGMLFVSDFGLARVADDGRPSDLKSTVAYQAPELRADPPVPATASDIYAFGVILWELLTGGRPPARGAATYLPGAVGMSATSSGGSGLFRDLLRLAAASLAPAPSQRPASFADIYIAILNAVGGHQAGLTERIMQITAHANTAMTLLGPVQLSVRIENLFNLGKYDLILEEIEAREEYNRSPLAQIVKAEALSLMGRDRDAIETFDNALELNLSARLRNRCVSGKGLALKRIREFDQATELLKKVVLEGPSDIRPGALMNLATVHIEDGDYSEALALLSKAALLQPGMWEIWVNMGRANEGLRRYAEAATAYQRAIRLAPYQQEPLMSLAAVCMDHLGRFGVAYATLEQLAGQGLMNREWATRRLVCLLVDEDRSEADLFATELRALDGEVAASIIEDAHRLLGRSEAHPAADDSPPETSREMSSDDEPASPLTPEALKQHLPAGWDALGSSHGTFPDAISEPEAAAAYAIARDGAPFLGIRAYMKQRFYCLDFFCAPDNPRYTDELIRHIDTIRSGIDMILPNFQQWDVPPYFQRCPNCETYVLTNRKIGTGLRCRSCARTSPTAVIRSPDLDELLAEVTERLGTPVTDISGHEEVAVVTFSSADAASSAKVIAERVGFQELELDKPITLLLVSQIRAGPIPGFGEGNILAFRKTAAPGTIAFTGGGNPETAALISMLRLSLDMGNSTTTSYDPRGNNFLTMLVQGRENDLLEDVKRRIEVNPHDPDLQHLLIMLQIRSGHLAEAAELTETALTRWPDDPETQLLLGELRLAEGKPAEASSAVLRSLAMSPVQPQALRLLARCCREMGQPELALGLDEQAQSLGGGV